MRREKDLIGWALLAPKVMIGGIKEYEKRNEKKKKRGPKIK